MRRARDPTRGVDQLARIVPVRARVRLIQARAPAAQVRLRAIAWRAAVSTASLDPFRGYASALTVQLPDAVRVLDPFHLVRLGLACVDDVRHRVQQNTTGHPGRSRESALTRSTSGHPN